MRIKYPIANCLYFLPTTPEERTPLNKSPNPLKKKPVKVKIIPIRLAGDPIVRLSSINSSPGMVGSINVIFPNVSKKILSSKITPIRTYMITRSIFFLGTKISADT